MAHPASPSHALITIQKQYSSTKMCHAANTQLGATRGGGEGGGAKKKNVCREVLLRHSHGAFNNNYGLH